MTTQGRPIEDLSDSGLLWLINRVVFHPRGFRLALSFTEGQCDGWILQGDGTEPHWFTEESDRDRFDRAEATLQAVRHQAECEHCAEAYGRGRDDEAAGADIPAEMGA